MTEQVFTHENELLAMAPLNAEGDDELFTKQNVRLIGKHEVQWDFILHDGKDWHFRQEIFHLLDKGRLREFKEYIRHTLIEESGR